MILSYSKIKSIMIIEVITFEMEINSENFENVSNSKTVIPIYFVIRCNKGYNRRLTEK